MAKTVLTRDSNAGGSRAGPQKKIFRDRQEYRSYLTGEDRSFRVLALLYLAAVSAIGVVRLVIGMPGYAAIPIDAVAFCIIGWAQYSIGNGMHEAVHRNLHNKNGDCVASLMTAYPIGLTMTYRDVHMGHHRFLGSERDPEFHVYRQFPRTKGEMVLRFLWFVSGVPALLQFLAQQRNAAAARPSGKKSYAELRALASVQLVILLLFWAVFGNPLYYVAFWCLPIATVGKLLSTTRLLCEHASPAKDWVVRTIGGSRWQTWLLGAFDFNYHAEHHLYPFVPYANLHRLHRAHRAYCEEHPEYRPFDGRFEYYEGGYLPLLVTWFRALPWCCPRPSVGPIAT